MKQSLVLFIMLVARLTGQVNPLIVGSGYTLPSPIYVTPGQLVTLIVQGLDTGTAPIVRAPANANLPTTLAGASVNFFQLPAADFLVPILEVHPFSPCGAPPLFGCDDFEAITVQIPFEAQSLLPIGGDAGSLTASFSSEPNAVLTSVPVWPLADQVHLITSCDPFMNSATAAPLPTGMPCPQIVAHADGSTVSVASPAKAGEEVVAYAVGLGQTNPASVTGQLVTTSAPTQITFNLDFNFRPNALASRPLPTGPTPIYAGTTPGYVGLYQINFTVPPVPAGTPPCVDASTLPVGSNVVQSNLTVSVGGTFSFDGARICVAIN